MTEGNDFQRGFNQGYREGKEDMKREIVKLLETLKVQGMDQLRPLIDWVDVIPEKYNAPKDSDILREILENKDP